MIPCLKCKEPMPKIRLEKFGYKVCCNCSTVKAQKAITIQGGSGDHTWNDIQIVSSQQAMDIKAAANIKPKWDNYEN